MHLTDRRPQLDAEELVARFQPPHRFEDVRFESYRPDPEHPSQRAALERLQAFAATVGVERPGQSWWKRATDLRRRARQPPPAKPAIYIDGGFGVGKTHLLAALWHASPGTKIYATFEELTAFVGFTGMTKAVAALHNYRLICIDEFELDDVANTLLIVSLLRGLLESGNTSLAATSNTLPDRLGEQRFSASEFRREIAAIASYFEELPINGPDYREHGTPVLPVADLHESASEVVTTDEFEDLLRHLGTVHPVHYAALLDDVTAVNIHNVRQITHQDDALLWVQFIDELYDARIPVHLTGVAIDDTFSPSYRNGGFRKKYGRAESRAWAMQAESRRAQ